MTRPLAPLEQQTLSSLREVPGLSGTFLVTNDGQLVWRDLPSYFASEALVRVAPRAVQLFQASSLDPASAECVIRFDEHSLYMRGLPGAVLCAVLETYAHMPSARTAVRLVSRRIVELRSSPAHVEARR